MSELVLVAVFVVGLLVVAVVSVRGIESTNRTSHCQTELRTLKLAVGEFHATFGRYPDTVTELETEGVLSVDEVEDWIFELGSTEEAPTFHPASGTCVLTGT